VTTVRPIRAAGHADAGTTFCDRAGAVSCAAMADVLIAEMGRVGCADSPTSCRTAAQHAVGSTVLQADSSASLALHSAPPSRGMRHLSALDQPAGLREASGEPLEDQLVHRIEETLVELA